MGGAMGDESRVENRGYGQSAESSSSAPRVVHREGAEPFLVPTVARPPRTATSNLVLSEMIPSAPLRCMRSIASLPLTVQTNTFFPAA